MQEQIRKQYIETEKKEQIKGRVFLQKGVPARIEVSLGELSVSVTGDVVQKAKNSPLKKENIYVVKSGDTLFSIANKFNVTVQAIKNINNLSSNILIVGQELVIPKEETPSTSGEFINYTVKAGDSLYKIANAYNTTVNAIMNVNNLTSNALQVGQVLKIPTTINEEIKDYINYTVKSGDSLYKIANNDNTTVDSIKKLNNLTSNNLQINQVLKIPTTTNQGTQNYINYTVKSGDSLYKIAKMYSITPEDIIIYNKLASTVIYPNQILFIPVKKKYITKNGDTLGMIANNNRVSLECLMNNNCIQDLALMENQKINTTDNKWLTITPGVELDDILKNYNISAYELIMLNKNNWLRPNEKIIVK